MLCNIILIYSAIMFDHVILQTAGMDIVVSIRSG